MNEIGHSSAYRARERKSLPGSSLFPFPFSPFTTRSIAILPYSAATRRACRAKRAGGKKEEEGGTVKGPRPDGERLGPAELGAGPWEMERSDVVHMGGS